MSVISYSFLDCWIIGILFFVISMNSRITKLLKVYESSIALLNRSFYCYWYCNFLRSYGDGSNRCLFSMTGLTSLMSEVVFVDGIASNYANFLILVCMLLIYFVCLLLENALSWYWLLESCIFCRWRRYYRFCWSS